MPDIFRKEYRALTDEEKAALETLKEKASDLHQFVANYYGSLPAGEVQRNLSLFTTKLEEAVMWGVKGITG